MNKQQVKSLPTEVSSSIQDLFQALKLRRKHKYLVFKLATDESGTVDVEKVGGPKEKAADFLATLPNSDCRFAIYDHEYVSKDGRPQSKLFFVSWLPINATPHSMMAYSAAKGVFRDSFQGVFDVMAKNIEEVEVAVGLRKEESDDEDNNFEDD